MKILIACETSGQMRERLRAKGHDVLSCDILPSEDNSPHHYTGDVRNLLWGGRYSWDAIVGHPPCTYLSSSGLHWNKRRPERAQQTEDALAFFRMLWEYPAGIVVLENPIGCASTRICKPSVIVQPYMFGDDASKATCLWVRGVDVQGLPHKAVWHPGRTVAYNGKLVQRWSNQTDSGQNRLGPSADRWKERSRTYPGIADYVTRMFPFANPERIAA